MLHPRGATLQANTLTWLTYKTLALKGLWSYGVRIMQIFIMTNIFMPEKSSYKGLL